MAKRKPEDYPRQLDEYPEIMSKMDPLIIRVSPTVLLVGSTTYTAKIKLGYRFNGFHVNVTGVGIPIYTEEVNTKNADTTNKSALNGMSDAYNIVEERATTWMDDLEKSMIDDSKEKNVVDLLREIKYQMHFDLSGHKYPAIIPPGQPGYDETKYDERMEICPEVPTYITDIYKLLAEMNARLNNLMVVIASDGTGGTISTDTDYGKNRIIDNVTVTYNDNTHGFDVKYDYGERVTAGLNERIGDINNPKPNSVIKKLDDIKTNVNTVATNVDTVATDIVDLKTQTETNATMISDRLAPNGDNIYSAVQILVGQMQTMNNKIGQADDSDTMSTLFGKMNLTNTRIGNSYDAIPDPYSIFGKLKDIKTDTNSILTKPILGSDVSDTTINYLNTVLTYLNASTDDANVRGDDTYIKALNRTSYNMVCWRGMDGNANTTLSEALYYSMRYDYSPYDYYSGPTAQERGYTQTTGGKTWGIKITSAKP